MQPPSVIIAANPYEAELCRRALVETGLRVVVAEAGEGVVEHIIAEQPLVLVLALGLYGVEPLELLRVARTHAPTLPIFLIGDRDGEVPDADAAALVGATRLFLRPIDSEALAHAIEKLAVEAEVADEVREALAEFSIRPPTIDADPLVEESILELEAEYEPDKVPQQVARIALRRLPRESTEILGAAPIELTRIKGVARADDSEPPHPHLAPMESPAPSLRELSPSLGDALAAEPGSSPELTILQPDESALRPFEVTLPPPQAPPRIATEVLRFTQPGTTLPEAPPNNARAHHSPSPGASHGTSRDELPPPPSSLALPDGGTRPRFGELRHDRSALLRADDALSESAGLGLQAMTLTSDFVTGEGHTARVPPDERSMLSRRLEHELSAAERRLFPDSPVPTAPRRAAEDDPYEDALGDIDLDRLGIDTIPGVGGDALEALRPRNGHATREEPSAAEELAVRTPTLPRAPLGPLPEDAGDLATTDIATLLASLHSAGFSGRLTVTRGDGEKVLFFDGGQPVFAASGFGHDRLIELLYRDGKINRDQLARGRTLPDGGRVAAQQLVELGVIKSSELFATMRHHAEEILYSLFAWDTGRYALTRELASPEDRARLGASPWALVVEGVRRKYGLERLVELVGPPDTVLAPTANLARALDECNLTPAERVRAEAIDGERALADLALVGGVRAEPLSETGLYALAWSLCAIGATRIGSDERGQVASGLPTLITQREANGDRRGRPRPESRERDRQLDSAVDKERVLAKRAQIEEGDYFAVLGLDRDATPHEIARAFERLKREFAADRFAESVRGELSDALTEIAEVLDEAQRVLGDERVRVAYRSQLPPS